MENDVAGLGMENGSGTGKGPQSAVRLAERKDKRERVADTVFDVQSRNVGHSVNPP